MKKKVIIHGDIAMKKLLIFWSMILIVSACQSVNFSDLNFYAPNPNLLPPLRTEVDKDSIKDSFDTTIHGSSAGSGFESEDWSMSGDSYTFIKKKDSRTRDMITLFERNVENISQVYGTRKGSIKMRFTNSRIYSSGYYYTVPSWISIYSLNLLGFPFGYRNTDLEVEVSILNNNGDLIWKSTEKGKGEEIVAMYYGYNEEEALVMSSIKALKDALRKINRNIANDFARINAGLQ